MKKIIGSYDSMSYLKPVNKWLSLYCFFTRSQDNDIETQYENGVRVFDMRVFVDGFYHPCFKSGKISHFTFSFYEAFSILNKKGDCYAIVTLEETESESKRKDIVDIENKFKWECSVLEKTYPNIKFMGGKRLWDNTQLYEFENTETLEEDEYVLKKFI